VAVSGDQIVSAAEKHLGLPYRRDSSLRGHYSNCYGLLLMVAQDLELLDPDFDINLSPATFGQAPAKSLWEILRLNFDPVSRVDYSHRGFLGGDVILTCHRDQNPNLREPHHVMLYAHDGNVIHAYNFEAGVGGSVIKQRVDELMLNRIDSVWRIRP
jgi:cell wall-associated NlpC family hydrolase